MNELEKIKNKIDYFYDQDVVNYDSVFNFLEKNKSFLDGELSFLLAECYEYGDGTIKNEEKALEYYLIAFNKNYTLAATCIGALYWEKGDSKNKDEAVKYYQIGLEHNEQNAIHNLGVIYSNEDVLGLNMEKAFELFHQAANLGHAESMFKVGWMYSNGEGVNMDIESAKLWLLKAIDEGHEEAEHYFKEIKNE